ncbi:TonB-dependent receptor [Altericroceibacterium spongiae]|uniref:TonB-dependent receptor n=1 Tax=Altericroceibacterium spongiae TaxID=2320269 RepID=A0A420EKH2_9SPHN|nr:TonB-dependent receptor [Altericroceibacterium spongiae]RKF21231.1 TonB-dependent receptor [Altericroceibacterium spongiae]
MMFRNVTSMFAIAAACACAMPAQAQAQAQAAAQDMADEEDTIIVTGTRRTDRSVLESAAPIDVFTAGDLESQSSGDMNNILRSLIPSYNVGRFVGILSDGSGFVRPPTLRGLPPDQILVLVNGKRRHRSAMVQLNGGPLASGAQGPDVSQIPSIAIERIEVLRDGASAQYGSDAIAGVINYSLRKASEGVDVRTRYGQYYEGDGKDYQAAMNVGLPLGPDGFMNVSGEFLDSGYTSRGGQRIGALAVSQSRPDVEVTDPIQKIGNPKSRSYRLFVNSGIALSDSSELYMFGNYGWSKQQVEFNWRQPVDATGPDQNGTGTALYPRSSVFNDIYLDQLPDGSWDTDGATYNFADLYPNGFKPQFQGKITDISLVGGYKGELDSGVTYDVSASYGQSHVEYSMDNSLNASLGPDSPTSFYMGSLEQRETNFNADLAYPWEIGLASPVTIAIGAEHRTEAYQIGIGDNPSYVAGPYTVQPLSGGGFATQAPGVSGFPGYSPSFAVDRSRRSYAGYIDVETDIVEGLTLGLAGRYEHFSDFGSTTNGKISARYAVSPMLAVRGTASTGFRAPTPGQLFTTAGITGFFGPNPVELLTLPADNPASIAFGSKPLVPEKSTNLSAGFVLTPGGGFNLTVDYYNIKVRDRMGIASFILIENDEQRQILRQAGLTNWATVGLVRYFANGFKTRTQGVDLTASHRTSTGIGRFETTLALNYNATKVLSRDPAVVDEMREGNIEDSLPKWQATLTENWSLGRFSLTARGYFYDSFTNWAQPEDGGPLNVGSEFVADLEARYRVTDSVTLAVGAENLFDNYPDKDIRAPGQPNSNWYVPTQATVSGNRYVDSSPFGYNGGFWYVRLNASF